VEVTFLFWNLDGGPRQELVADLAAEHGASFVLLAECQIDPPVMTSALSAVGLNGFEYHTGYAHETGDLRLFMRLPKNSSHPIFDDANNHITIRRVILPHAADDFLLAVVHLQSKVRWTDADQAQGLVGRLARYIEEAEKTHGHSRTILVGDLNVNPFETGIVGSEGLHAVVTRKIATRGDRKVDGLQRAFFYNPMWRFFGERTTGPPGTYYYEKSGAPISYYWNIFDQVLLRPALAPKLIDVQVLHRSGTQSLLTADGVPDRDNGSDHLPILFTLDL
jgi:exonuclease III